MNFKDLRNSFILTVFFLFSSSKLFGWSLSFEPFVGGQLLGSSSFSNNTTSYSGIVTDYTYGGRAGLNLFGINIGGEYYLGKETQTRDSFEDKWDKSSLGIYLGRTFELPFSFFSIFDMPAITTRLTYYFSPKKKLVEDNHAGVGSLNDEATGAGGGLGLAFDIFSFLRLNYDLRYFVYNKVGTVSLPTSYVTKVTEKEHSVGLSVPLTFFSGPFEWPDFTGTEITKRVPATYKKTPRKEKPKIAPWKPIKIGSPLNDDPSSLVISSNSLNFVGYTAGLLGEGTKLGERDIFLANYDLSGKKVWIKQIGTQLDDVAHSVKSDAEGNIYFVGSTRGEFSNNKKMGQGDIFISKYSSHGSKLWTKQIGTVKEDMASSINIGPSGLLYVAGFTKGNLGKGGQKGGPDAFLMKLNRNGEILWSKQFGTKAEDMATALVVSRKGNIFVTGTTYGQFGLRKNRGRGDIFLAKFNSNGKQEWVHTVGGDSFDRANALKTDLDENIYIAGQTRGKLKSSKGSWSYDILVMKYRPDGQREWDKVFGTTSFDSATDLVIHSDYIYLTGHTSGSFNKKERPLHLDIFLLKLNPKGEKVWLNQYRSQGGEKAKSLTFDDQGNFYVLIESCLKGDFYELTCRDILVHKIDQEGILLK